ncbi:hypothetical protein HG531_006856 [Fusarium graminearum]|nr:hypothetical protein HG531_006856 [Fusarium graminearum]
MQTLERQRKNSNFEHEMNQSRAKHEFGRINFANSVLDGVLPVRFHRNTVKDGHKGTDGEPDDGAALEDVDSNSHLGDTSKQTPVEAKDGKFGESE